MAFFEAGHEIGSHSVTHPNLAQISQEQLDYELTHSKQYLESIVGIGQVNNFATPYGAYSNNVIDNIRKYYNSQRSTDESYNSKDDFDANNIKVQNMTNTTELSEVVQWIEKAKTDKTWLVIVYHRIADNPGQYDATPENFYAQLRAIDDSDITVKTVADALSEINSQIN